MSATSYVEHALLIGSLLKDSRLGQPSKTGRTLVMVSASLLTIGFAFFLYAAFIWASAQYGVQMAAAGIGVALMLSSLCAMAMTALYYQQRRARIKKFGAQSAGKAEAIIASVLAALEDPVKDNPKLSVLLSAFTGYKAGRAIL